ncbi:MAG: glycosyltransferase [Cytophagales bacterium]|nr:glycosyltransferase [Cytophagales bacterium]
MHIVHAIFSFETGGAENLLIDIVNEQAEKAPVSLVIVNKRYTQGLLDRVSGKVNVYRIDRKEGDRRNPLPILRLWSLLFRISPGVIHCHDHGLVNLLPFWRAKTAITVHDVGIPTDNIGKFNQVFAISMAVQEDLLQRGNVPSTLVPNGINFPRFGRRTRYAGGAGLKMIQISRLVHEKKGQHLAIRAVHQLVIEYGYSAPKLFLVGEGPSLTYLQELTRELGVEEFVVFMGVQDRQWIMQHLQEFDLLLQPSLFEGFGLTVLEGIAAGLPVIASAIDGPAEILKDIPSGFLFDVRKECALTTAIMRVASLYEKGQIARLCQDSVTLAERQYSIGNTAARYHTLYSK